ncbi:hypothetical protein C8A00DRAFT_37501 [Chaetomidium leptoderma]|uniref:Uncharacterized protein n=1 Tax=Chaetomidium leptoderma TaxID=669021 RepID=A0AAN6VEF7_9PEZI|nr:hypothetical protein C8A00DRAFT_37501 [Chaetomidium leptoderma]
MQNTVARTALQDEPEFTPELVESPLGDAHTIKDALELYRLSDWGFVLFRCTYRSQEKWERFVALVQGHARDCFEEAGMMDVYARMRWTVFEDAAALDGADIVETSRRFVEWVERGPGGRELAGSVFGPSMARAGGPSMATAGTPRHEFFLHVDEESLESVVDDAKARERGGYFSTMVRAGNVVLWVPERDREKGVYCLEGRELEEDEMCDLAKRVRIDDLVSLYAGLQVSPDLWYWLRWSDDNIFGP